MNNFKIIAEIGCTHIGSLERAKQLAKLAKLCGADILKTQKRNPKESTKKELWNKPHPNQIYSYGPTYLKHRENVELDINDHYKLKDYCEEIGIEYSTSVFDVTSAKEIIKLNPKTIKIPSACNNNEYLIDILLNNYKGKVYISSPRNPGTECTEVIFPEINSSIIIFSLFCIISVSSSKVFTNLISLFIFTIHGAENFSKTSRAFLG